MPTFDLIALDADDTLWHTEYLYAEAQAQFKVILARYISADIIDDELYETEINNLAHFGYGIKGFALSMIETAIDLTRGQIKPHEIQSLLDIAKDMLSADVRLIDHVAETLTQLASTHRLMLLTKGDLYDQESKIQRSGLSHHFQYVEIVSQKFPATYAAILAKHNIPASRFVMIGNSLRSDILPVLEIGAYAIHIPHPLTWAHEMDAAPPDAHPNFFQIDHIREVPAFLDKLD